MICMASVVQLNVSSGQVSSSLVTGVTFFMLFVVCGYGFMLTVAWMTMNNHNIPCDHIWYYLLPPSIYKYANI